MTLYVPSLKTHDLTLTQASLNAVTHRAHATVIARLLKTKSLFLKRTYQLILKDKINIRPTLKMSFTLCPPCLSINMDYFNPLNAELNPICHLLALLGVHHLLHVSRITVKVIRFRNFCSFQVLRSFDG